MTLAVSDLSKRYGKREVITSLTHAFAPGLTLVTGRSGAGKSTLLRVLATVERPSSGSVSWQGRALPRTPRGYRRVLGYAPQAVAFPDTLTGEEFLLHIGALKELRASPCRAQARQLLDRVGLGADGGRRIATYSGGMRRRLGLVQALLGDPRVVVLDEPTAELDPLTIADVHALIGEVAERATVVMTTHLGTGVGAGLDIPHATLAVG